MPTTRKYERKRPHVLPRIKSRERKYNAVLYLALRYFFVVLSKINRAPSVIVPHVYTYA